MSSSTVLKRYINKNTRSMKKCLISMFLRFCSFGLWKRWVQCLVKSCSHYTICRSARAWMDKHSATVRLWNTSLHVLSCTADDTLRSQTLPFKDYRLPASLVKAASYCGAAGPWQTGLTACIGSLDNEWNGVSTGKTYIYQFH